MASAICPKCGHSNAYGALFCANCFTLLTDTIPVANRTTTLARDDPQKFLTQTPYRTAHVGKLNSQALALYIENAREPVIMLMVKQTVLGRAIPGELDTRFDLTPYGALDKGVSRQHAILKRTETGITLEDMQSSNGSYLNGTRLKAYMPSPVISGDRLRLGQLELEIYLPDP